MLVITFPPIHPAGMPGRILESHGLAQCNEVVNQFGTNVD